MSDEFPHGIEDLTSTIIGFYVPVSNHHATGESHPGSKRGRPQAGRVLLSPVAGCDRDLCRSWYRLWTERRHLSFPNDVFGTGYRMGGKDCGVPQGIHGQVSVTKYDAHVILHIWRHIRAIKFPC